MKSVSAAATDKLVRTFEIVADRAPEGLMTYGEFAGLLGVAAQGTGPFLSPLLRWCRLNDLPPLPIIVVNKGSRVPSSGNYEPTTIQTDTQRVREHDWSSVTAPTRDELVSLRRTPDIAAR